MSSLRDFRIYYYGATNIMSLRDYKYTFFVLPIFYIPTGWFIYYQPCGILRLFFSFTSMSSLRDFIFTFSFYRYFIIPYGVVYSFISPCGLCVFSLRLPVSRPYGTMRFLFLFATSMSSLRDLICAVINLPIFSPVGTSNPCLKFLFSVQRSY